MSAVFDSSALLAIAFRESGAEVAARALSGAQISAVNAAEVVSRLVDSGASPADAQATLLAFGLTIHPFDTALAIDAGLLRAATRQLGLSLGDRACMVLARRERARVITADRSWAALDLGIKIELIR